MFNLGYLLLLLLRQRMLMHLLTSLQRQLPESPEMLYKPVLGFVV